MCSGGIAYGKKTLFLDKDTKLFGSLYKISQICLYTQFFNQMTTEGSYSYLTIHLDRAWS